MDTPVIIEASNYDENQDVKSIVTSLAEKDISKLIAIICRRTNSQRQKILKTYKQQTNKNLMDEIKKFKNENFVKFMATLLTPTIDLYINDFYSVLLEDNTTGLNTFVETLLLFCTLNISEIKQRYDKMSNKNADSNRYFEKTLNICEQARKCGSLEQAFLMTYNKEETEEMTMLLHKIKHKNELLAENLHKYLIGLETVELKLVRLLISRAEIDLVNVKSTFENLFGKKLKSYFKNPFCDYQKALLTLIGEI